MRSRATGFTVCFAVGVLVCVPPFVEAQQSRADEISAEQARKAAELKPYQPGTAERWITKTHRNLIELPSGLYPYFGSVYSGGGFTLGAGYRDYYGDRTHVDLKGLYSLENYKLIEVSTDSWGHSHGRLDLHGRLGWRDATQVAFYGIGNETPDDRSSFRMKQGYVGGDLAVRPVKYSVFGAGVMYEDFTMQSGSGSGPSIEEVHTPETAPGLGVSPKYMHTWASAGFDWRPAAGYARRGGLYEIRYLNYADQDNTYSFDRVEGEVVQHIPVLRENWVISLHGRLQTTLGGNDAVPYFLLPSLGSGSTLRGYSSWRFRDRHAALFSGEYRWIPSRLVMDAALFYDAGTVADRFDGLSINHLKTDVGFGVRFHTPLATPLRIELAKGNEGLRLVFAGSAAF